jgi:hypothetical protein
MLMHLRMQAILQTNPLLLLKISADEIHLPQVCIPQTANTAALNDDLTGRSEELEREASDLRRENSWLKEIVLLKGGRLGAFGGSQSSSSQQQSGRKEGPSSDTIGDGHITQE